MLLSRRFLPIIALTLATSAFGQGDECSNATVINGLGSFPFDTSALTSSQFGAGGACGASPSFMHKDGFLQWTVPATGDYTFDTAGTNFLTGLALHLGMSCSAVCIYHTNASLGSYARLNVYGLIAGDLILIQVGGPHAGSGSGPGNLNISNWISPCSLAVDDPFENNDTCATPTVLTAGSYTGLYCDDSDPDFYEVTVPSGMILLWDEYGRTGDTDYNVMDSNCNLLSFEIITWRYNNSTPNPVTLIVEAHNSTQSPSPCSTYDLILQLFPDPCVGSDDAFEDNDDCLSARPVGDGTYSNLRAPISDPDFYSFCVALLDNVTIDLTFVDSSGNLEIYLWDSNDVNCGNVQAAATALAQSTGGSDNERISWSNMSGENKTVILQVVNRGQSWLPCNSYDLVINGSGRCGTGNAGFTFCDPGSPNSTGAPAVLFGNWGSGIGSDLKLEVSGGPHGEFAYILVGSEATFGIPISNGLLCLSSSPTAQYYRYNQAGTERNSIGRFDFSGEMVNGTGTSTTGFGFDVPITIPATIPTMISVGDSWSFQCWYRDTSSGVGTSNLSNGLHVTF